MAGRRAREGAGVEAFRRFDLESSVESARAASRRDSVSLAELDLWSQHLVAEDGAEIIGVRRIASQLDRLDSVAVFAADDAAGGLELGPIGRANLARRDPQVTFGRIAAGVFLFDHRRTHVVECGDAFAGDDRVLLRASRILAPADSVSG